MPIDNISDYSRDTQRGIIESGPRFGDSGGGGTDTTFDTGYDWSTLFADSPLIDNGGYWGDDFDGGYSDYDFDWDPIYNEPEPLHQFDMNPQLENFDPLTGTSLTGTSLEMPDITQDMDDLMQIAKQFNSTGTLPDDAPENLKGKTMGDVRKDVKENMSEADQKRIEQEAQEANKKKPEDMSLDEMMKVIFLDFIKGKGDDDESIWNSRVLVAALTGIISGVGSAYVANKQADMQKEVADIRYKRESEEAQKQRDWLSREKELDRGLSRDLADEGPEGIAPRPEGARSGGSDLRATFERPSRPKERPSKNKPLYAK